jgi:hypothetical protein
MSSPSHNAGDETIPAHREAERQDVKETGSVNAVWFWFKGLLSKSVSGQSLAAFRTGLGLIMVLEAYSLCSPNVSAISTGESPLAHYYTGPDITFHFPYTPFEWLPVLPQRGMYVVAALQALAGITLALGLCCRISAITVFLAWGYFFAVESTRTYWQSHFYLELLLCFLMIWMPAARRYTLTGWLSADKPPDTVPFWSILLLRGQLVIAYFYAGVAKINLDWLLDAVPVRWFLAEPDVTARYQHLMSPAVFDRFQRLVHSTAFAYFLSYTGLLFDLGVGFLLLFRRTRIFAMLLMVGFHAINHFLIFRDIGWFPLVGIATSLIFLDPDWPERFWKWLRHPGLSRPDWKWFWGGAVVFPVVGAALGWKLRPTRSSAREAAGNVTESLSPFVAPLVLGWLLWQALIPLRHYAIPGDARFTYEGLSFSWRLKAEVHSARAAEFHVHDDAVLPRGATNLSRIRWDQWHGDKVIYRWMKPGSLQWEQLPEFVIVLEALSGERILYNPYSSGAVRSEAQAQERIIQAWQKLYGHPPQISRTTPVSQMLVSLADGLRAGGDTHDADQAAALVPAARKLEKGGLGTSEADAIRESIFGLLEAFHIRDPKGQMTALLRTMDPFALAGQLTSTFLLIEDHALFAGSTPDWPVLNRSLTIRGPAGSGPSSSDTPFGGAPMVVYTSGEFGSAARFLLPQAAIIEAKDQPDEPFYILWNTIKDVNGSKINHISNQAFYLRRYALRVAALWEKEYRRRPAVTAITGVSLNGRPFQPLVKPDTDLANVSVAWFGHNQWIEDLKTPRVPREALNHNSGWFVGQ